MTKLDEILLNGNNIAMVRGFKAMLQHGCTWFVSLIHSCERQEKREREREREGERERERAKVELWF